MKRLLATIIQDLRIQQRNGFYAATAVLVGFWLVLFSRLPGLDLTWLLPVFVLDNLVINSFYFIGGLVLLERGEGTLEAQIVTPLRIWEYLAAKAITLAIPALLQNTIIAVFLTGMHPGLLFLIAGTTLASTIYVLAGFAVVARYASINEYLLPSTAIVTVLLLPLFPYMTGWDTPLIYLHPMQAPLLILRAAFQAVAGWQIGYGFICSVLWVVLAYLVSRRVFRRFVMARGGL